MATFTGTAANETITPAFVSATVAKSGGSAPSSAVDQINAGGGNDTVEGGGGADDVQLGAGNDLFTHRVGDGDDAVNGGGDTDTYAWIGDNGSGVFEIFDLTFTTGQLRADDSLLYFIERIEINLRGGNNIANIGSMANSSVQSVLVDQSLGSANLVSVEARAVADTLSLSASGANLQVLGLSYAVTLKNALAQSALGDSFTLEGLAGDDVLDASAIGAGGAGTFIVLEGGDDDDQLIGSARADVLDGGDGGDFLTGGAGGDTLRGGVGTDTVDYAQSAASVAVVLGKDDAEAGSGFGGDAADDKLYAIEAVIGTAFADTLLGNNLVNRFDGGAGADQLYGSGGGDNLAGGAGADVMDGGADNDIFTVDNPGDRVVERSGEGTADTIFTMIDYVLTDDVEVETLLSGPPIVTTAIDLTGNSRNNNLFGNGGANRLDGGGGADFMVGYAGNDIYIVDTAGDIVFEESGNGTDTVRSAVSYTLASPVERLVLTGTADRDGTGNGSANLITGNSGDNDLRGEGGADALQGGAGNDRLFGGAGNDTLNGEAGLDRFYFNSALNAATNKDKILAFNPADDSIYLSKAIFAGIGPAGTLAAAAFRNGTAAADATDRIIYDKASGNIWFDSDGNGAAAKILFATLSPGVTLTNADFVAY